MSEKWFIEGENGMEIALTFPMDKEEVVFAEVPYLYRISHEQGKRKHP